MNAFTVVVLAGAISYLLRISMLVLAARTTVPAALEHASRFAVPVAFAALAATALGSVVAEAGAEGLPAIGAVAAGGAVARRTGSSASALLAGMPALWLLSAVTV